MNAIKSAAARAQQFVSDNKTAIITTVAVAATAAVAVVIIHRNNEIVNEFLEQEGLLEKFHAAIEA